MSRERIINKRIRNLIKRIEDRRRTEEKFSKGQAYYVDEAFLSSFKCQDCRFYDRETQTCNIVSSDGDPNPGRISPLGSCALFNARPPRIAWYRLAWGRGDFDGVAPEKVRATYFMYTYAALGEEPPEDLEELSLIDFETVKIVTPERPFMDS